MSASFQAQVDVTNSGTQRQLDGVPPPPPSSRLPLKKLALIAVPLVLLAFTGGYFAVTRGTEVEGQTPETLSQQVVVYDAHPVTPSQVQVDGEIPASTLQTAVSVVRGRPRVFAGVAALVVLVIVAVVVTAVLLTGGEEVVIPDIEPEPVKPDDENKEIVPVVGESTEEQGLSTGAIVGLSIGGLALVAIVIAAFAFRDKLKGCARPGGGTSMVANVKGDFGSSTAHLADRCQGREMWADPIIGALLGKDLSTEAFAACSPFFEKCFLDLSEAVRVGLLLKALHPFTASSDKLNSHINTDSPLGKDLMRLMNSCNLTFDRVKCQGVSPTCGEVLASIVKLHRPSKPLDHAIQFIDYSGLVAFLNLALESSDKGVSYRAIIDCYSQDDLKGLLLDKSVLSDDQFDAILAALDLGPRCTASHE